MVWIIVIITLLIGGELWRMGGDGKKWARAVAFPVLIVIAKLSILATLFPWLWINLLAIAYWPLLWGMMSAFSYGITAPPHKFVVWCFGGKGSDGNYKPVEITTRALCGFFWSLPAAVFAYITGGWIFFTIYVIFLTIANGLIGGLVKNVEISERGVGYSVAVASVV